MVATYPKHIRLQFGGTLGNPAIETWSNTVNFVLQSDNRFPFDPDDQESIEINSGNLDESLVALSAPLVNWFKGADARIGRTAVMQYAKLNMIMENGRQREQQTHQLDLPADTWGQNTAMYPHWFQTVALTHRTAVSRGRGHSGRIFPPVVCVQTDGYSVPYIDVTAAGSMASAWAVALVGIANAINDATELPTSQVHPVVVSVGNTTAITTKKGTVIPARPGRFTIVEGVVCDRVADVQHRRTHQVARLEAAYAPLNIDN